MTKDEVIAKIMSQSFHCVEEGYPTTRVVPVDVVLAALATLSYEQRPAPADTYSTLRGCGNLKPLKPLKPRKARIIKNAWDNWLGYLGANRTQFFANAPGETAEQAAQRWLKLMQSAKDYVTQDMDDRAFDRKGV